MWDDGFIPGIFVGIIVMIVVMAATCHSSFEHGISEGAVRSLEAVYPCSKNDGKQVSVKYDGKKYACVFGKWSLIE